MRISDWSSDVCSSDLERLYLDVHADVFGRDAIEAHDGGVADGVENAVMDHGQELAIRSDRGKRYHAALAIACAPAMIGGEPNQCNSLASAATSPPNSNRTADSREGKECGTTGKYPWTPYHDKKKKTIH